MSLLKAFSLGIVQGLTEFLPVSSSGHLALFQVLFGMKEPMLAFDVALHAGTLVAVFIYFRKELGTIFSDFWRSISRYCCPCLCSKVPAQKPSTLWFMVLLTLIPTGLIGVLFKDYFESSLSNLTAVGWQWVVMGLFLIPSSKIKEGTRNLDSIGWWRSLVIGVAQAIALIPAISRSGSTILAGMALGIKREDAAKISFLISIPAIIAAVLFEIKDGGVYFATHEAEVMIGFLASTVSGYAVIKWLMGIIRRGRFSMFGYYCVGIGIFSIFLARFFR